MSEKREVAAEALWRYAFDGTAWADAEQDQRDEALAAADAVLDAVTPLIRAEVLREAADALLSGEDFALRSGTNDIDAYDHGVIAASKRLREWAASGGASR